MNKFQVIYNQDCTNLFHITKEPILPSHVDTMVGEVADGGADVFLINPQAQRANYPSKVWQTFWDGYTPGDRSFFGLVTGLDTQAAELAVREAWVAQMKRLADQGCDYLERALARCRKNGILPGITVRMNDMHDAPTPGTHLFSRFYMDHPELHLSNDAFCSWGSTGLNYEFPETRDHYLSLIRELAHDYDCDVLELDFMRFHCYFPRCDFARHCAIMTEFVRHVRSILDATGRRISLLARVAATPAAAYELGFDVAAWARAGLVDGITTTAFLNTQWRLPVDEFRALVGDRVAVYACTDYYADQRPGLPSRYMPGEPEMLRGFAAAHLAAGADGIEVFNFFCPREELYDPTVREPSFPTLREMRDLAPLRGSMKTYTVMTGKYLAETDGSLQVPVTIANNETRSFEMLLCAEPEGTSVESSVVYSGASGIVPEKLWLRVNNTPVGPAQFITGLSDLDGGISHADFAIPSAALIDGRNELAIRNEGDALTIQSIDVRVGP